MIPNELAYLKQKDLHKLSKHMESQPGDFDRRYPNPDAGGRRWDDVEEEYGLEASVVLKKTEDKWLRKDNLILLRWKIKNGSIGTYSRKKQRIEKLKEIVSELNSDEKEELAILSLPSSLPTLPGVDENKLEEDDGALLKLGENDE